MAHPIRVLIAKPGLDGHDRGALVVAQGLRDQGMEVIYTGLRQTPEQIVATAIQEDVACIGLSSLSGAHLELFPEVTRRLKELHAEDILVIGGGVIPQEDIPILKQAGIAEVFTPGSSIADMAAFIREHVRQTDDLGSAPVSVPVNRIDHIGIAVRSIQEALPFYTGQLGLAAVHEEVIPDQKVKAVFVPVGETDLELLEPTAQDSPIAKFLEKHGPGLHHIAYAVDDVAKALSAAKAAGYRLIDEVPRDGGQGKRIGFVHPKDTHGTLTEFCQRVHEHEAQRG
ncbi:methylmalonyl-CoA epimerase [Alicyclobacillus cycloheptanicus]|uniref:Methylmalonyl-CoA mutase C-terminal domain/subunit n=1 Tax=Alicyclobacillus cycloheptanicus TaxID=1457 RepID=A0ABT9XDP1_9BACL|nr:methylmalonyl-CoA epimerase [Alicyclobacillus cycloheptanicus]MDQ0188421.1 methylmalonyl-CoA mutase C-terminal domain/subunit [Alicyclobacillus cycloheptanicus]WDM01123.1 methylmalonyl-CoA epimerase [Alicyclobacillus cycloheptanicus]